MKSRGGRSGRSTPGPPARPPADPTHRAAGRQRSADPRDPSSRHRSGLVSGAGLGPRRSGAGEVPGQAPLGHAQPAAEPLGSVRSRHRAHPPGAANRHRHPGWSDADTSPPPTTGPLRCRCIRGGAEIARRGLAAARGVQDVLPSCTHDVLSGLWKDRGRSTAALTQRADVR